MRAIESRDGARADSAEGDAFSVAAILRDGDALGRAHDVELEGDRMYVPGKDGSLAVVDVSDPTEPAVAWARSLDEDAQTVLCAGRTVFVGGRDFHALATDGGTELRPLATLRDRPRIDQINGMVRRGNHLLYANKAGWIGMIDVTRPSEPRLVGALNSRDHGGLVSPHDIALYREHIVVVDQRDQSPLKARLYRVIDSETGELLPPTEWRVAGEVTGDRLNGANRVDVYGDFALIGCNKADTVAVIDLSDPDEPQTVTTLDFPGAPCGLVVAGAVLFAAGGRTVRAYSLADPREPRLLGSFTSERAFPSGLARATAEGQRTTEVEGEAKPMRGNAHDLVYRGGYVFVTAQSDDQVAILEVRDPEIRMLAAQPPPRFPGRCEPVTAKRGVTMTPGRRVRPQSLLFGADGRLEKVMYSTDGSGEVAIASSLAETPDGGRSWIDHAANPVLDRIESAWQGRRAFVTAVTWDDDRDCWVMATVGDDTSGATPGLRAVGLWFSDDLTSWRQHDGNPIITVETDHARENATVLPGPHDPPVGMYLRDFRRIAGAWHALVQWRGGADEGTWSRMAVMRSESGITGPWRFRNRCLDPAEASAWSRANRNFNWSQPVRVAGRWYAACQNGVGPKDEHNTRIGIVYSDDYFHWREFDNPVTAPLTRPDGTRVVSSQQFLLPPEDDAPWRILLGARGLKGRDRFVYLLEP